MFDKASSAWQSMIAGIYISGNSHTGSIVPTKKIKKVKEILHNSIFKSKGENTLNHTITYYLRQKQRIKIVIGHTFWKMFPNQIVAQNI